MSLTPEPIHQAVSRKRDTIVSSLRLADATPPEYDEALHRMEDYLHGLQRRCTIERRFILQMLYRVTLPVDVGTLHQLVCSHLGNVSLTTVYTTLDLLVQLGLARRLDLVDHAMAFFERTLGLEPHGYIVCTHCGSITLLRQPQLLHDLQPQLPRAFVASDYTLVIHGMCAKCRRAQSRSRRKGETDTTSDTVAEPRAQRTNTTRKRKKTTQQKN